MNLPQRDYIPINCGFHDRLESWAVTRVDCEIEYYVDDGEVEQLTSKIKDVFSRGSEEFVQLQTGQEIRLDRIRSINGISLPTSC
jgi:Rho-binding antiterminator